MVARMSQSATDWRLSMGEYLKNTNASETDSAYLRRLGLKPNVIALCGDCHDKRVLDVGSADGWLSRELGCQNVVECDIVAPARASRSFVLCDATDLPFAPSSFDVVVSSLVLMWLADLPAAYRAAYRITRPHGRLVVALVHPHFYRTGRVNEAGNYELDQDLSRPWEIPHLQIAGRTGPFRYNYYRYDEYLMCALDAGWQLDAVRDWFVDMDDYRSHVAEGEQLIARTGKVPLYTFIRFVKPLVAPRP
jgi:SAM-dependent methyltransferase